MSNPRNEDYWKSKGIHFSFIKSDDYDQVVEFMDKNFFPDEPQSRAIDVLNSKGTEAGNKVRQDCLKNWIQVCLKHPRTSIWAKDKDGRILGVRLGEYVTRDEAAKETSIEELDSSPEGSVVELMRYDCYNRWIKEYLGYGKKEAFEYLTDANMIFEGHAIGVSREARGLKLGQELVRRSMDQSQKDGCQAVYILVSGIYSLKLFKDLGFKVIAEKNYADGLDRNGDPIFNDNREHVKAQIVYKKL